MDWLDWLIPPLLPPLCVAASLLAYLAGRREGYARGCQDTSRFWAGLRGWRRNVEDDVF